MWNGCSGWIGIQDPYAEAVVSERLPPGIALRISSEMAGLPLQQLVDCPDKQAKGIGPPHVTFVWQFGGRRFRDTFDCCSNSYAVKLCWRLTTRQSLSDPLQMTNRYEWPLVQAQARQRLEQFAAGESEITLSFLSSWDDSWCWLLEGHTAHRLIWRHQVDFQALTQERHRHPRPYLPTFEETRVDIAALLTEARNRLTALNLTLNTEPGTEGPQFFLSWRRGANHFSFGWRPPGWPPLTEFFTWLADELDLIK